MTQAQGAGVGAVVGAALGGVTSIIGLRSQNKAIKSQIAREGAILHSQLNQINLNREQLDRELGDILSANALESAKNMATASVIMSTSGTVGGTTKQVSKQAYMDKLMADAEALRQARNQEKNMMLDALNKQAQYRMSATAARESMASPLSAFLGTLSSSLGMAMQGASAGYMLSGATGVGDGVKSGQHTMPQQLSQPNSATPVPPAQMPTTPMPRAYDPASISSVQRMQDYRLGFIPQY